MAKVKTLWNKADKRCGDWFRCCKCRARGAGVGRTGRIECSGRIEWAHIVSRSVGLLRWHPANAVPLCSAHHRYYTQRPLEFAHFIGEKVRQRLIEYERIKRGEGEKPNPQFWIDWYNDRDDTADTWSGKI